MDKGLEHDVEQVEDQREEDVDHVGSVDETGLEPKNEIMQSCYFLLLSLDNSLLLPLDVNDGRQQDDDGYGDVHVVQDVSSLGPFPRIHNVVVIQFNSCLLLLCISVILNRIHLIQYARNLTEILHIFRFFQPYINILPINFNLMIIL